MQSGSNSIELSDRSQTTEVIARANLFLKEVHDIQEKYKPEEKEQFLEQFRQLDQHERYTCAEIILSNAWGHINHGRLDKARSDLAFILPLCEKKEGENGPKMEFSDFQIDRMIYESWLNEKSFSVQKKGKYRKLLEESGFSFEKFNKPEEIKRAAKKDPSFWAKLSYICCGKKY